MRDRFLFFVLVICGSFFVYCAQDVVGGMKGGSGGNGGGSGSSDGMVGNAGADTCCTPPDPPAGTVLFDQTFTPTVENQTQCYSPAIDVGGNRTVILHGKGIGQYSSPTYYATVEWSFGGVAGWVRHPTLITTTGEDAVVSLDGRLGKQLRVFYGNTNSSQACTQTSLTVVGYKQ